MADKTIVPVPGNPILDKTDTTSPPNWARYEVRLTHPNTGSLSKELANSLAKHLHNMVGSSNVDQHKWQVDWVYYTIQSWGHSYGRGSTIFMLRFEDPSDGVMAQMAISDNSEFKLVDSFSIVPSRG